MDYEKLGSFYLGRDYDPVQGVIGKSPLLYDARDLCTHAVCVGMTGSGKTGLCVSLLEEAAIDGIPAIVIDPKGDLGNLMLTFPDMLAENFRPWIDDREAERKGMSPDEYARSIADTWREGLADWGQSPERIARLKAAAEFAIYTPASSAGRPISALHSFSAPDARLLDDADGFRERVASAASGLLALLGIDVDPVQSREHILLSNIFDIAWRDGRDLDLGGIIRDILSPPIERIGVMDLEDFFSQKDRTVLAMTLNNLLASPSFAAWTEGEPIDVSRLLWTESGKPKVSIISIAHLSEAERMFFVTILLNEVGAWMRTQAGTNSLRALLYMDEIFGFFPPTANPPSKLPMLRLLKQARAYGLGIVLATQNPVDLDYKGLSNTGTWFLGRLQTERDILRVVDGLQGAASQAALDFDKQTLSKLLAGLKSRVFLMNNVHEDGPALFHTRWAMSYLRGPLTRMQIKQLQPKEEAVPQSMAPIVAMESTVVSVQNPPAAPQKVLQESQRPTIDSDITEKFVTPSDINLDGEIAYHPFVLGSADLHYVLTAADIDTWNTKQVLADVGKIESRNIWEQGTIVDTPLRLEDGPVPGVGFLGIAKPATKAKSFTSWEKSLKTMLYKECPMPLWKCTKLKMYSFDDESEAAFSVRVRERARERRDEKLDKLREKYGKKVQRLDDQIMRATHKLEQQKAQYTQAKYNTALSAGSTILGALFGRKLASRGNVGKAATTMRGVGRAGKERQDVQRAEEKLAELRGRMDELSVLVEEELAKAEEINRPDGFQVIAKPIRPRKSDTEVKDLMLVWIATEVG